MSELIEAAKNSDHETLGKLLAREGAAVDEQDDVGWTPLSYAAGRGDVEAVKLLLDHGADVTQTGRDLRTPLEIAKAAGRREVAALLTEAEKEKGVWVDPRGTRPYCKAYLLQDLRRFPGWSESEPEAPAEASEPDDAGPLSDESVVYVHQDLTVTRSIWHGEDVVFDRVTPEWEQFCVGELEFAVPEDLL
jgi:ankyrin repeat protein